jgi:hypothetical protein
MFKILKEVTFNYLVHSFAGNYDNHNQFPKREHQTDNFNVVEYISLIVVNTTIDCHRPHEYTNKMKPNV